MNNRFVTYLRISFSKLKFPNSELSAQRRRVSEYLSGSGGDLVKEFIEEEPQNGITALLVERPALSTAIEFCQGNNCTLVIANTNRLNFILLAELYKCRVRFIFADSPELNFLSETLYAD